MTVLAAIDVGSNALRLAIGAVDPQGLLKITESHREAIRLGGEVFATGEISLANGQRVISAFERFKLVIERNRVSKVRAVATSALREARNGAEIARQVEAATGIKVEIIGGDEEARLVFLAVSHRVKLSGRLAFLVDIGGGSVELSLVSDGDIIASETVKMGAVRLLQLLEERKRGHKVFARLVEGYAQGLQRQLKKEIKSRRISLCIGTGGNIEALGDLRVEHLKKKDDNLITVKDLEDLFDELRGMAVEERVQKLNLKPDRADVIVPAIAILRQVLRYTNVDELQIPHVGLKDGVLLELSPQVAKPSAEAQRRQVVAYALEVGRKFIFDEPHALTVARLAVQIFDDARRLHKLGPEGRLLLEVAAILHDVGQFVHSHDHHKHSYYLIMHTPFIGLDARQRSMVACIARYHRKSAPKRDHDGYRDLSELDRETVRKLAALLRIADGADCSHSGRVRSVRVSLKEREVRFGLLNGGDALLLERWAVEKKGEFLEQVFGTKCTIDE